MHGDRERKHMKHIKKDNKVVCPVCNKEYTHSSSLKDHVIKKHQTKDVLEKGIYPRLIVGDLMKEQEKGHVKTDFQEIQQFQQVWANVKIDGELYDMIMGYS